MVTTNPCGVPPYPPCPTTTGNVATTEQKTSTLDTILGILNPVAQTVSGIAANRAAGAGNNFGCGATPGIFAGKDKKETFNACFNAALAAQSGGGSGLPENKPNYLPWIVGGVVVVGITGVGIWLYRKNKGGK